MCGRVDELIREWERTGVLSPRELALVDEHVQRCPRCARAHGVLLSLLRCDAGAPAAQNRLPAGSPTGSLSEGFSRGLMRRLAEIAPLGAAVQPRRRAQALRLPLAVAAGTVLVLAAFFVWFWGARPGGDEVLVRFELVAPEARSVSLVGDFNGWDSRGLPMKDVTGQGDWRIAIRLKKGGVYTYNFLMDGRQWVADPRSLRQVDDGFGGTSSLLEL